MLRPSCRRMLVTKATASTHLPEHLHALQLQPRPPQPCTLAHAAEATTTSTVSHTGTRSRGNHNLHSLTHWLKQQRQPRPLQPRTLAQAAAPLQIFDLPCIQQRHCCRSLKCCSAVRTRMLSLACARANNPCRSTHAAAPCTHLLLLERGGLKYAGGWRGLAAAPGLIPWPASRAWRSRALPHLLHPLARCLLRLGRQHGHLQLALKLVIPAALEPAGTAGRCSTGQISILLVRWAWLPVGHMSEKTRGPSACLGRTGAHH